MSRSHHTSHSGWRPAVVALTLGAALAACAEGLATAPSPAARAAAPASHLAADSGAAAGTRADSLALPPGCAYTPDSARLDSTGVDPDAFAAALACRDSVSLQYPFDYPMGDAFALPARVSVVGAISGTAADPGPPDGAAADSTAAATPPPCAGADTVGTASPASTVVCVTLRNEGAVAARVTFAPGLVIVADAPDVQNGVVVTPIAVEVAAGAERRVALAAFGTGGWRRFGTARDAYRLGPVSTHPVVRELVSAVVDSAAAPTPPTVIQELVWLLAEHGNDEMTEFLREMLHRAPPPSVGALRAALARRPARVPARP